jgi:hypothetical protein
MGRRCARLCPTTPFCPKTPAVAQKPTSSRSYGKTDVAMVNEVLCKIICHNICCLIQETHELGIDTVF